MYALSVVDLCASAACCVCCARRTGTTNFPWGLWNVDGRKTYCSAVHGRLASGRRDLPVHGGVDTMFHVELL